MLRKEGLTDSDKNFIREHRFFRAACIPLGDRVASFFPATVRPIDSRRLPRRLEDRNLTSSRIRVVVVVVVVLREDKDG